MDYEKKIRDYMNSSEVDQLHKSMLINLFPELVEPQEEKARRSLLEFLEDLFKLGKNINFDRWSKADCGEWVNWVMKQGKQKPANSIWHDMTENPQGSENDRTLVVFEDGYSTTSNALLHIGFGTSKSYKWAYVNDILRLTSNAKLSEQKPVDKVEQKFKVGDIIRHKEQGFTCKIIAVDTEYRLSECNGTHLPFDSQDAYELVEHNPAEWSETDKLKMETIIHVISNQRGSAIFEGFLPEELINWLNGIKDRVHPKPKQEWSEEDESLRLRTIGALETCKIGSPTKCVDEQINWLKSLSPQSRWRPSKEQMEALKDVIENHVYDCRLEELLEQLKKSREE